MNLFNLVPGGATMKPELLDKVYRLRLNRDGDLRVHLCKYFGYRKEGLHWSEWQEDELLSGPHDVAAGLA